jgi:hypothetical protein
VGDIELRYEHLGKHRETSARKKRREQLHARVAEIWAEQEEHNRVIRENPRHDIPLLRVANRYAGGGSSAWVED